MKNKKAFTLAEILITLVVIGIIAAITISIINTNIRKAEIETKLKKTISTLNSVLYRASVDYGPAYNWPEIKARNQNACTDIINKYIKPYIIAIKSTDKSSLAEVGYKERPKTSRGVAYTLITEDTPKIFLNDGTILLNLVYRVYQYIYVIDINGPKGPNVAGIDIFEVGIDSTKQVPYAKMFTYTTAYAKDSETGEFLFRDQPIERVKTTCKQSGMYCGSLIQNNSWKIPDDYPIKI